jgi:hypothetical protein
MAWLQPGCKNLEKGGISCVTKTKATLVGWLLKWGGFITTEVDPSARDHETGLLFAFSRMHLKEVYTSGQGADVDAAQVLTGLGIGNGSIRLKISVWASVSADTSKAPARAAVRNSFKPLFAPIEPVHPWYE